MTEQVADSFTPPYISFAQLLNVLERMQNEGVPSRVDRSYLGSWSGSAQGQFLKAARSLGLIDEHGRPTELLKRLVREPESRPEMVGQILQAKYPDALALGQNATQHQLEEAFRNYNGISGSTTRKAVTFFLHAAKFAGIPTSPFFKPGRASSGGGAGSRPARSRGGRRTTSANDIPPTEPTPPPSPLAGLHPAIVTLVQSLPEFETNGAKPEFSNAEREAWFEYARATFNLIYALPDRDAKETE
jgi:hypothetical protein